MRLESDCEQRSVAAPSPLNIGGLDRQVSRTLFITIAPYECSWPYAHWLEDELARTSRTRTNLAGPETLHMAHVLKQVVDGLMAGANKQNEANQNCWRRHILGAADGSRKQAVVTCFARLEFQESKRKRNVGQTQA